MISFWRQLRFLLWKGCLVKKRQKKWLVAELITPIILFAILALVRLRDFTTDGSECHFTSKGFPSAGLLPFMDSFLCAITNRCNRGVVTTGDEGAEINIDTSNQSAVVRTIRELSAQFENIGANQELFNDIISLGVALLEFAAGQNDTTGFPIAKLFSRKQAAEMNLDRLELSPHLSKALASATLTLPGIMALREYAMSHVNDSIFDSVAAAFESVPLLCNKTVFDKAFNFPHDVRMTEDDREELCNLRASDLVWLTQKLDKRSILKQFAVVGLDPTKLNELYMKRGEILQMFDPLVNIAAIWHGFNRTDKQSIIDYIFCAQDPLDESASSNQPPETHVATLLDKISAPVMQFVLSLTPGRDDTGNQTHCFDIKLHDDLDCSELESQAIRQIRPMLSGFILVTPDAPIVRRLVEKLEAPLKQYQRLFDTVKSLAGTIGSFQSVLTNSTLAKGLRVITEMAHDDEWISDALYTKIKALLGPEGAPGAFGTEFGSFLGTVGNYSKCFIADRFRMMPNESQLENVAMCLQPHQQYFTAIVFPNLSPNATEFDETIVYKIRHEQNLVDGTDSIADSNTNVNPRNDPLKDLKYLTFGWSFLQEAIDRALIEMKTNRSVPIGIYSQQEPYPCIMRDTFDVTGFMSFFIVLSWIIPSSLLVKNIVYEKEHKLKELMRIMGLGDTIHFLSWALISLVLNTISVVVITILLWVGNILGHTNPLLLFFILMLFAFSSIAMSLLITTFFSSSNIATAATALLCLLFSFPFMLTKNINSTLYAKATLALPQTAIGYVFRMLSDANKQDQAGWGDIDRMRIDQFDVKMWECLLALFLHLIIFCIFAWYISALFPGVYGVGQKWYFPFTLTYWMPKRNSRRLISEVGARTPNQDLLYDPALGFEQEPTEDVYEVDIQKLSKVYSNDVKALDGLNLRLYEGQITALLGHNGAGKTTTMSLLCGLYGPSSGTAKIYGHDIRRNIRGVRDVLGICPQHNVLFAYLTVQEQLRFYAWLKGVADKDVYNEVNDILDSVALWDKRDNLANTLSGGMKRRLSIGIALIGGSKFVILDEPTAGVDVNSRKDIWKLLLKHKKGRTILLSTHHMDEADVLADRIAILSEGRLKALGSSVYLKRKHGHSYKLTLVKNKNSKRDDDVQKICAFDGINCRFVEETEEEIIFLIPIDTSSENLQSFFEVLDARLPDFGCVGYGVQAPSLQQIFVNLAPQSEYQLHKEKSRLYKFITEVCCGSCKKKAVDDGETLIIGPDGTEAVAIGNASQYLAEKEDPWLETNIPLNMSKSKLALAHAKALFAAKALYMKRSWKPFIFQIVLPILLLFGAELYSKYIGNPKVYGRWSNIITAPPLILTTALFGDGSESYLSVASERTNGTWPARLIATFEQDPGVGIRCLPYTVEDVIAMKFAKKKKNQTALISRMNYHYNGEGSEIGRKITSAEFNPTCYRPDQPPDTFSFLDPNTTDIPYNINRTCGCDPHVGWTCTQDDYPIDSLPTFLSVNTTDIIRDLSGRNISQYRLITRFVHSLQNLHSIIGGWSFGHENVQALDEDRIHEVEMGVNDAFTQLAWAGLQLGLNSSYWTGNSTMVNDTFAGNYTFQEVLSIILANQDTKENIKIWFNNKIWPSLPIYYNAISNAIFRALVAENENLVDLADNIGIVTFNHPMNRTAEDSFDAVQVLALSIFRIVLVVFAFCIIPAGFASFLVTDRETHSMHLQLVSGLKRKMYWMVEYIFDFMIFILASLVILVLYRAIGVLEITYNFSTAICFLTLYFIYGLGALFAVFILQRLFSVPSLAFILIAIGLFFIGVVACMVVIVLEQLMKNDETLETAYNVCSVVFMVLSPQFNLGMGVYRGSMVYQVFHFAEMMLDGLNRKDMVDEIPLPHLLSFDIMGRHVIALTAQAIVLFIVFCVAENGRFGVLRRIEQLRTGYSLEKSRIEEDDDVTRERERVRLLRERSSEREHSGLIVYDLAKTYGSHLAVKGVSFAVAPGECFGLLGLNGAGKTTTFAMLTGKHPIGHGEVEVAGSKVVHCSSDGFRHLGYCPQFDALHMKLTTEEQLTFYARIRGVPEHRIRQVVSSLLLSLHLRPYAKVLTADLSGGNKRKLSVAVALVSQPPVILLDEPSAGMDPGSQQFLWTVVTKLRKSGRAVVLTSHSMEECEALCTRIAIMDDGRVRCIGAKQHLKTKFGEGYTLTLKTPDSKSAEEVSRLLLDGIRGAKLTAIHCSTVFLHIPDGTATVAELLHHVNKVKSSFPIEDFALSQTTLDDIFHSLSATSSVASRYSDHSEGRPSIPDQETPEIVRDTSSSKLSSGPSSVCREFVPNDPAPSTSADQEQIASL